MPLQPRPGGPCPRCRKRGLKFAINAIGVTGRKCTFCGHFVPTPVIRPGGSGDDRRGSGPGSRGEGARQGGTRPATSANDRGRKGTE
jgi:hypothetical protein